METQYEQNMTYVTQLQFQKWHEDISIIRARAQAKRPALEQNFLSISLLLPFFDPKNIVHKLTKLCTHQNSHKYDILKLKNRNTFVQ